MEIINDDRKDIDAVVDRIDRYRVAAGLSMYMLAEKAGFSENTLKYIYKRRSMPKLETIARLCAVFGVSLRQFFLMENTNALLTAEELQLIELYERISPDSKKALNAVIRNLK